MPGASAPGFVLPTQSGDMLPDGSGRNARDLSRGRIGFALIAQGLRGVTKVLTSSVIRVYCPAFANKATGCWKTAPYNEN